MGGYHWYLPILTICDNRRELFKLADTENMQLKYVLDIHCLICQCKIVTFQKFWTRICDEGYSSQHLLKFCCWICASFTDITNCQDKMGQLLEGMTCLFSIKCTTSPKIWCILSIQFCQVMMIQISMRRSWKRLRGCCSDMLWPPTSCPWQLKLFQGTILLPWVFAFPR